MININNISVTLNDKKIITDFSAAIPNKGIVAVTGKSGSGKTTLLNAIAGLVPLSGGNITGLEDKKLSMIFQQDRLIANLSVYKNVRLTNRNADAAWAIEQVGLSENINDKPDKLSGGMQRRIAIARAINYKGDVLIADEPFKGLDENTMQKVYSVIKNTFPLIIMSVHEISEAKRLGCELILTL